MYWFYWRRWRRFIVWSFYLLLPSFSSFHHLYPSFLPLLHSPHIPSNKPLQLHHSPQLDLCPGKNNIIKGCQQRMKLQRRLYRINTVCFFIFMSPYNCEMVSFSVKLLNKPLYDKIQGIII